MRFLPGVRFVPSVLRAGIVGLVVLALPLLVAPARAVAEETVRVAVAAADVRSAPDPSRGVIGQVHRGEVYVQVGARGAWKQIWYGLTAGWVNAGDVVTVEGERRMVKPSSVDVRTGPGTGHDVVGTAVRGSWWAIAGEQGEWRRVCYGGAERWIHGQHLGPGDAAPWADAWDEERIADGVVRRRRHFRTLYGGPQMVNVLEVDPRLARLRPIAAVRATETSAMARVAGAVAAVNGVFYAPTHPVTFLDFLLVRGRLLYGGPNGSRPVLGVTRAGEARMERAGFARRWPDVENAIGGHPWLIEDGRLVAPDGDPADDYIFGRNPRTAAGITRHGKVLLVTVDGRAVQSIGVTFDHLERLMKSLGCVDAMNLDGGGSTTMWIRGEGVVNYPSDDGRWGHGGERAVGSCYAVFADR